MELLETVVAELASFFELLFSAASILVVIVGGVAFAWALMKGPRPEHSLTPRTILAKYLIIALELQLAADIISTATYPSWQELGKLAAIAAIRTFLNFFLVQEMRQEEKEG